LGSTEERSLCVLSVSLHEVIGRGRLPSKCFFEEAKDDG
jgi:hypothetical protein